MFPVIMDVNHPRQLLIQWREEAKFLEHLISQHPEMIESKILAGQVRTLYHCAEQLESRLRWSEMLDA